MMTDRESAVAEQIAFAAADTVLFFAPQPKELVALQRKKWLPVIERVNGRGSNFTPATGLDVPVLDNRTRAYLKRRLDALDDDSFAAFCQASGGLKSVILALSVLDGDLTADQAFDLAVLEELFQNRFWKTDEDAVTARENRKRAVGDAFNRIKGGKK